LPHPSAHILSVPTSEHPSPLTTIILIRPPLILLQL
jgi:hypothetical protein